jgi:DNA-directed RNA polymerase subunit RPC12/RpoP
MFAIECPRHGHRVLVPETRIRGLHNTPRGIRLEIECWCGARVTVRTGRSRPATADLGEGATG